MRYDVTFISISLICVLAGMSLGIWMGMHQDFTLAPAHAHINLAGWVTLCLYGLVHRAFPALATAKLAPIQAFLAIVGGIALPIGIALAVTHPNTPPVPAIIASFAVILGALLFFIMFLGKATFAKAT